MYGLDYGDYGGNLHSCVNVQSYVNVELNRANIDTTGNKCISLNTDAIIRGRLLTKWGKKNFVAIV